MKISDEAVEAARKKYLDGYTMRVAIQAALTIDGYPKLLAEALAVMRETGWPNAIDHATSDDGVIEAAAYETYVALKTKMGA